MHFMEISKLLTNLLHNVEHVLKPRASVNYKKVTVSIFNRANTADLFTTIDCQGIPMR